jgi:hypothetical protein
MAEIRIDHEAFDCSKTGGEVTITRHILVDRSPPITGEIDMRTTTKIDCDGKEQCGVGKRSGPSMSFDWTECVHPEMKQ